MTAGRTKWICDACFGLICEAIHNVYNSLPRFSILMKPFAHHLRGMNEILFLIEHLNVLEEFLNITISGSLLCPALYLWEYLRLRKRREFH